MKKFNLAWQINKWRRDYQLFNPLSWKSLTLAGAALPFTKAAAQRGGSSGWGKLHPALILILMVVSLTSMVGDRFYNQPQLAVGTVSPVTIEAPRDGRFEDATTTAQKRRSVRTGTVPILKTEINTTEQITQSLAQLINQIDSLRQLAGPLPFVDVNILNLSAQQSLRSSQERQWQTVLAALNGASNSPTELQKAVEELQAYREQVDAAEFQYLLDRITRTRQDYAKAKQAIATKLPLEPTQKAALLQLSDETWRETKIAIDQALARILTQGIPPGLPPQLIAKTVQIQLDTVPPEAESVAAKLLTSTVRPNLTEDTEETKRRAETAARAIEPVIVTVKQGDVIVEQDEIITQADFVLLDAFNLSRRAINWAGLGLTSLLVAGAIGIFWLVERRVHHHSLRFSDQILLGLLSLSAPILIILGIKYTSLPAIGLLVGSFYSPALGIAHVGLLTGLLMFGTEGGGGDYLLAGAAGGLIAALVAGKLRSREELAILGAAVGIVQGSVYLIINLIMSATAGTIWYAVLPGAILYGVSGLAWCVVAQGVSPYLERLFDIVTPIRLAELSNPNRPLLKRLATEAPGTFQHTMMVASLAECAARELHCNVELVRAGTLYHDIGKLHDPLGFIENQMGGPNKHDEINNPWLSAKIIKKHVTEGIVMARRYGLPKAIQNFIPEHQGNLPISYFYFKAKQQVEQEGGQPLSDEAFCYDGPIPQSRETGIVMLADSSEAALRSLQEATPKQALAMISKIFKARWRENQLVDSGIKYEELPKIGEIFVRVWQQSNHKRISYPKAALEHQRTPQ